MVATDRPVHKAPEAVLPADPLLLTAKGKRTRERFLGSARAVLESKGYFETSVADIAEDSELALGTFYRYFANKEQAFMVLLEQLVEELYEATGGSWQDDDPRASLIEATRRYLTAYKRNRKLISALLQMAAAVPDCAAVWADLRQRTHQRMAGHVASQVSGNDTELAVTALATMVEYSAYRWFIDTVRGPAPSIRVAAETLGRIWYRALYEQAPLAG